MTVSGYLSLSIFLSPSLRLSGPSLCEITAPQTESRFSLSTPHRRPSFLCTETRPPLLYHLTAVSNPSKGVPSFWATGWLGPQQYLSYNSLRREAVPCGAWMWENQMSWYWEKETVDLKSKEQLFLEAIRILEDHHIDVIKGGVQ